MNKLPFYLIFIITLAICAVPTFGLVWYLESAKVFEGLGLGNTVMTAVVVSMLPALLISIWWWNFQYRDDD